VLTGGRDDLGAGCACLIHRVRESADPHNNDGPRPRGGWGQGAAVVLPYLPEERVGRVNSRLMLALAVVGTLNWVLHGPVVIGAPMGMSRPLFPRGGIEQQCVRSFRPPWIDWRSRRRWRCGRC
jgi:hypothetical protein